MLQQLYSKIYSDLTTNTIDNLYKSDGYYVFRRKMHNSNQYYAYLKANNQSASTETLTLPALVKYALPPNSVLDSMEKSPRLTLGEGFRVDNWTDAIGEFYGVIGEGDLKPVSKKYKTKENTLIDILNKHAIPNTSDKYIYSIYIIEKLSKEPSKSCSLYCAHLTDITQKSSGLYSLKSTAYSTIIEPYTFTLESNKVTSEFGRHAK